MADMLEAALSYAKLGWHIFPCKEKEKIPITSHGVKDATTNEKQIKEWWTRNPNANIALACGIASGICVVDIDVNKKVNGWQTLNKILDGRDLQESIVQKTPTGGAHILYQYDPQVKNENGKRFPGIDIRTNGYYIIITPSVHPNGKQYSWKENLSPFTQKPAEFPAFIRDHEGFSGVPPWRAHENLGGSPNRSLLDAQKLTRDILSRASAYLEMCDPAIQGEGGHNKLLWAAVALVHGFKLSDTQVYDLLRTEYNPRCEPPWDLNNQKDHKDFVRKISEARKLTPEKPIGWLIDDDSYLVIKSEINDDDIDDIITNSGIRSIVPVQVRKKDKENSELQFLVRPTGLLGRICSHINKVSMKPQPLLALGCSLSFLGALFGRKIKDDLDSRTNLYCMGIAPSSSGKNIAPKQIRRLMLQTNTVYLYGGDDFASDAGIEVRISKFPSTIFLCDEIGFLVDTLRKHSTAYTAKIISVLMKLYSSSGDIYKGRVYSDTERQIEVIQPCCCVWGTSTPEIFLNGLSQDEITNGWLSRCLIFQSGSDPEKRRNTVKPDFPKDIVEEVFKWSERIIERGTKDGDIDTFVNARFGGEISSRPPSQILVPIRGSGNNIFIEFDKKCSERAAEDSRIAILWKRCEENARKIALIVAASENFEHPEITGAIADYSCRLVYYLVKEFIENMCSDISSSFTEKRKLKILKIISSKKEKGCLAGDLTRNTRELKPRERKELLHDLIEGEEIIQKAEELKNKRVIIKYWIPSYYANRAERITCNYNTITK